MDLQSGYQGISTYTTAYVKTNPGSHGVVQLGSGDVFHRSFISSGVGIRLAKEGKFLPVFGMDMAHTKVKDMTGRIILLMGRTGDGKTSSCALASCR